MYFFYQKKHIKHGKMSNILLKFFSYENWHVIVFTVELRLYDEVFKV